MLSFVHLLLHHLSTYTVFCLHGWFYQSLKKLRKQRTLCVCKWTIMFWHLMHRHMCKFLPIILLYSCLTEKAVKSDTSNACRYFRALATSILHLYRNHLGPVCTFMPHIAPVLTWSFERLSSESGQQNFFLTSLSVFWAFFRVTSWFSN